MHLLPLVLNRTIKLLGNIFKITYPLIHLVKPSKRYKIPEFAPATKKLKTDLTIPRIIWQTNFTNKVTLPLYVNFLYNRLMSRGWEYRYMSHETREEFIKKHGTPKEIEAYSKLLIGASQADFWRVFVLNKVGGVYMDFEANLVWPIEKILKDNPDDLFLSRDHDFTNYFIASKPNNTILQNMLDDMVKNILNNNPDNYNVYGLTGPGVFNRFLNKKASNHRNYRYTCVQDTFSTSQYQYIDRPNSKWTNFSSNQVLKK